jgi:hypothetical protein
MNEEFAPGEFMLDGDPDEADLSDTEEEEALEDEEADDPDIAEEEEGL